ncbi:hypothetical protein F5Y03DRAFT_407847 [Xylaria venustula]|nr:hypothetical protein F5Y03DRAFT_407847 [Xylaria venustula]
MAEKRAFQMESELKRLKQQLREAQQRAEEAEQQTRNTTLAEYVEACHELVFTKFAVETDKSLTSQGSTTNPRHKLCPTRLLPWPDFLEEQKTIFGTLYATFPTETEAFESKHFLHVLGKRLARKKVANEKALEYFQHNAVEEPVRSVFERLVMEGAVRNEFDIGNGIVFENHPNAISDVAEEVVDRRATQLPPRRLVNQICVYKYDNQGLTERSMAYIVEYKAPHKLTLPHLRLGLRPMDIHKEVVNRATKPTVEDAEALFQYHADRLAVAAATQTFHYMIEGGLEYGFLTTGEALVFLRIDWADPTTLYYHLAEPGQEVLAFSLLALGLPGERREHGQEARRVAIGRLKTWTEDYDIILRSIPASERKAPPNSPAYRPTTYRTVDRSPYLLRRKKTRTTDIVHPDIGPAGKNGSPEPPDDESGAQMPGTPTRPRNRGGGQRGLPRRPRGDSSRGSSHRGGGWSRQFCTQKCLLGLVRGTALDETCPNVALHRGQGDNVCHPISHAEWRRLLREQLERTLDDGVVRLGKQGARGVLFQITLLTHGYTFVCKGTVPEFVTDLNHEATVYDRLQPLQGVSVPVFLGAVDLRDLGRMYYYDLRVRIVYMILLAWAGDSLDKARAWVAGEQLSRELVRSVQGLHMMGVAHTDVRMPNALWCQETSQVMLIDFERAILTDPPRLPLARVVPNKRARLETPSSKAASQSSGAERQQRFRNDMSAAMSILPA